MPKQWFMEYNVPPHFLRTAASLALPLLMNSQTLPAQTSQPQALTAAQSELVVVVRHAEKGTDDPVDPTLSAAGVKRAEALAVALANADVDAIVTTQFKRALATAAPLATKLAIKPTVLAVKRGETAAHIAEVVAAVHAARAAGKGTILVIGHSNTVPLIVKALSGIAVPNICESQHANLYLLALGVSDKLPSRLVQSSYGDADPPVATDCK